MTIATGAALRSRLDVLEARGRAHCVAVGRRDALVTAISVAVRSAMVVPLLAVVLAFLRPVPTAPLLGMAVGVPLVLAAAVLAMRRSTIVDRDAALALFDREPGFKDRIAISDEFLILVGGGGFHAAAVAEAGPWVGRALDMPLAQPALGSAVRPVLRRGAPWLAAAVVLLILALLLGRPVAGSAQVAPGRDLATGRAAGGTGGTGAAAIDTPHPTGAVSIAALVAARLGLVDALRARSKDEADPLPSGDRPSRIVQPFAGAAAGGAGGAASTGAAGSVGGGQGAAGQAGGAGGAGDGSAGGTSGGGAAGAEQASGGERGRTTPGTPPRPAGDGGRDALATAPALPRPADAARRARERENAAEAGQPSANAPGSANPADRRASSSPPRAEQAGRPGQAPAKPGESGERQEQAQGNKPGQGSNSPGSAQDALKRSRGLSSLLLAVPTVDRLTGTPDQGAARSTLRQVAPQAHDAAAAVAGARGVQGGDAGVVARRPATGHEARLVRDYFARGGGAGGKR